MLKVKEITLQDREHTFTFVIKEMPVTQLESWITRALLVATSAGVKLPGGGTPGLASAGELLAEKGLGLISTLGALDYDRVKPLLDEMLGCCYRKIDKVQERCTPETVDGYIQDVTTLFKLRVEAFKLNLGFLQGELEKLSGSPESTNT